MSDHASKHPAISAANEATLLASATSLDADADRACRTTGCTATQSRTASTRRQDGARRNSQIGMKRYEHRHAARPALPAAPPPEASSQQKAGGCDHLAGPHPGNPARKGYIMPVFYLRKADPGSPNSRTGKGPASRCAWRKRRDHHPARGCRLGRGPVYPASTG